MIKKQIVVMVRNGIDHRFATDVLNKIKEGKIIVLPEGFKIASISDDGYFRLDDDDRGCSIYTIYP
jgi:hypothetical protein